MADIEFSIKAKVADLTSVEVGESVDLCDTKSIFAVWMSGHGWIEIRLVSTY